MMPRLISAKRFVLPVIITAAMTVVMTGCSGGPDSDQTNSGYADTGYGDKNAHEPVEHFVPDHWPADLRDAADKLAQRASALAGPSGDPSGETAGEPQADAPVAAPAARVEKELRDIVGWVPEIAADTPLTEAEWMVVYEASESLSKRLKKIRRPLDNETLAAIDQYRGLLVKTAEMLGEDSQ
jgi:hypothetical protein